MMQGSSRHSRLEQIRHDLELACSALSEPSLEVLQRTAESLEAVCCDLAHNPPERCAPEERPTVLRQIRTLQEAIHRASRTVDEAWAFHSAWAQRRNAAGSGYTSSGQAVASQCRRILTLAG